MSFSIEALQLERRQLQWNGDEHLSDLDFDLDSA